MIVKMSFLYLPFCLAIIVEYPAAYDWRTQRKGNCQRGDWAFAAIGMLEGYLYKMDNIIKSLSVQELLECSGDLGNTGCSGGDVKIALRYIKERGISTHATHPFNTKTAECDKTLPRDGIPKGWQIEFTVLRALDESVMQWYISNISPIAATISAFNVFRNYKVLGGEIFIGEHCSDSDEEKETYTVLIIGYGEINSTKYWTVKNWIDKDWGKEGYAKIARGSNTGCRIFSEVIAITNVEKDGEPAAVFSSSTRKPPNENETLNEKSTLPTSSRRPTVSTSEENTESIISWNTPESLNKAGTSPTPNQSTPISNPEENTVKNASQIFDGNLTTKDDSPYYIASLLIVLFVSLVFITIGGICLHLWHKRKEKRLLEEAKNANALGQWMKTIIVQKFENKSDSLQTPLVKIQLELKSNNEMSEFAENLEYVMFEDKQWEFIRENLKLCEKLGEGEFGKVMKAEAWGIVQPNVWSPVAVKMLKDSHTDEEMVNLVSELEIMKMMERHENILSLLGCCTQKGPLFIITEYATYGNLKDFLRQHLPNKKSKAAVTENGLVLNNRTLITFASQVAKGMEYLASIKCIHRDLATRNILVCEGYKMKIADFGFARDIHKDEYYKKNTNGKMPIKWMAPESVFRRLFTCKSDVWSYGILLWEIMTFGETPYPAVSSVNEIVELLRQGYRMENPKNCSLKLYNVMQSCWNDDPQDRPTFSDILQDLKELLEEEIPNVDE